MGKFSYYRVIYIEFEGNIVKKELMWDVNKAFTEFNIYCRQRRPVVMLFGLDGSGNYSLIRMRTDTQYGTIKE